MTDTASLPGDLPEDLRAAAQQLASGGIIVLHGDALRGGDIDFVVAARHADAQAINFLATHGRGLVCLGITPARALRLGITLINSGTSRQSGRPLGRSIEASEGVSTGISAADRAHTIAVATAPGATAEDIVSPGHVFPLIARAGGVLERPGAVEAAVELCTLAGAGDAAVLCSVMREDGSMARIEDMQGFIAEHGLASASIDALIAWRNRTA